MGKKKKWEKEKKIYRNFLGVIRSPGDRASVSMRARNFMGAGYGVHVEEYREISLEIFFPVPRSMSEITFLLLPGPKKKY